MRTKFTSLLLFLILLTSIVFAQKKITGRITDAADGNVIAGVSVVLKGTNKATQSDANGFYSITAKEGEVLIFKYIGYDPKEIIVKNVSIVNISLQQNSYQLTEITVTDGYITKKKGAVTGAISLVEGDKVASKPSANMMHNLQGQVPGVTVLAGSGRPGVAPQIYVRGQGSINSSIAPLYVMDGQPISASDFAQISAENIESFNILKDAAATAIYGSRGANGVVLITTKKGIKTGTRITYQGYYGYEKLNTNKFNMMNTRQRLDYEIAVGRRKADDPAIPELLKSDFNQVKEVYQQPQSQSHTINIRTGNEKTQAYIAGEYINQDGIYLDSKWQRYSGNVAIDNKTNDWLKLGASLYAGYTKERMPNETRNSTRNTGIMAYLLLPYENIKDESGNYKKYLEYGGYKGALSDLWIRENNYQHTEYGNLKLIGNAYGEINFTKQLKLRSSYGANYSNYYGGAFTSPIVAVSDNGNADRYFSDWMDGIQTNTLNFTNEFDGVHLINAVIGTEYNYHNDVTMSASAKNTSSPQLLEFGSMQTPSATAGSVNKYRMFSFFGSVNYGYNDTYFVDLSLRRDGSSKFGKNNRWGTFWAAGASWNLKKEAFLTSSDLVSLAKLRTSVGVTGNDGIGYYPSYDLYSSTTNNGAAGLYPSQAGNDDLTWEKKRKFNVGFDLGLFRNKLNFSADYYRDLTYDMVLDVPVSYITGYSSIKKNMGEMYNRGIELSLAATIFKDHNWNISGSTNFSYNKNRVTELYGFRNELLGTGTGIYTAVGYPFGQFNYNRFSNIDPETGVEVYLDKNGNPTKNYDAGNSVPLNGKGMYAPYNGGVSFDASYKGLGLFMQWNYVAGKYTVNNTIAWMQWNNASWSNFNRVADLLDNMWKAPGDIAKYPKYGAATNFDDRYLENASFLRLKELTFYYNFPKSLLNKTKSLSSARIYARANNLITITQYTGYDPEFFNNLELGAYPVSQKFTAGVDVTF